MNQRPQPLPASVPPCTGEHLGSWLSRVAAIYDVSVADLFNHCHIPGPVRGRCWITLPVLQSDQLRLFAQRLRMPMATLKAMNATDWSMTSPIGEVGYCPRCFEADQRAGHPLYWRLAWLDGFNTWCLEHRVPLNTTAAAPLNNIRNWSRVRVSSFTTFAPKSNRCDARIEDAAYKLQLAVSDGISSTLRQSMYGLTEANQVREVASDLLDVLLMPDRKTRRNCVLMQMACLQGYDEWVPHLSIPSPLRTRRFRQVRQFAARQYAFAVASELLIHSKTGLPNRCVGSLYGWATLRAEWLWAMMANHALEMLRNRALRWPENYVQRCWPELLDWSTCRLLRRRKIQRIYAEAPEGTKNHLVSISQY